MEDSAKEEEWTGVWREVSKGGERERWEKMRGNAGMEEVKEGRNKKCGCGG